MYEKPSLTDYGNLEDLTQATDFAGIEDAGSKLTFTPHHS